MVELLIVIGIIAILVGVLLPTIARIRIASQESTSRAAITTIDAATRAYFQDFRAYPGPFGSIYLSRQKQQDGEGENIVLADPPGSNQPINDGIARQFSNGGVSGQRLTGTENLVLGLMGGIQPRALPTTLTEFKVDLIRLGAQCFADRSTKRYRAYLAEARLSAGKFADAAGVTKPAKDSNVPEFMDAFASPLPILYLRANRGGQRDLASPVANQNNDVITELISRAPVGQFSLLEIAPYTQSSIGGALSPSQYVGRTFDKRFPHGLQNVDVSKSLIRSDATFEYPFNSYAYLRDPQSGKPRGGDAFVLISAGRDRVYGTEDDLTNFGNVLP